MNSLLCCYFPTTVYLVDDSDVYLRFAEANLPKTLSYHLCNDVVAALEILQNRSHPKLVLDTLLKLDEDGITHPGDRVLNCLLSQLHRLIYNPQRFSMISAVFADHSMPLKTGIEFCEEIPGHFIQKVIVTGIADEKLAVKAFNQGIIDGFITKGGTATAEGLFQSVTAMQQRYFQGISDVVYNLIGDHAGSAMSDPIFIDFFNRLCEKIKPTEYYLLDQSGSYLFLDSDGIPSWLFVKSEADFEYYCDIARGNGADQGIIDLLNNRQAVPFLLSDHDYERPVDQWQPFLHPSLLLKGRDTTYYYAYVQGDSAYQLDKVYAYGEYLAVEK